MSATLIAAATLALTLLAGIFGLIKWIVKRDDQVRNDLAKEMRDQLEHKANKEAVVANMQGISDILSRLERQIEKSDIVNRSEHQTMFNIVNNLREGMTSPPRPHGSGREPP